MSDDSLADFRQADGRFAKANRGGAGGHRPVIPLTALEEEAARQRREKRREHRF